MLDFDKILRWLLIAKQLGKFPGKKGKYMSKIEKDGQLGGSEEVRNERMKDIKERQKERNKKERKKERKKEGKKERKKEREKERERSLEDMKAKMVKRRKRRRKRNRTENRKDDKRKGKRGKKEIHFRPFICPIGMHKRIIANK